MSATDLIPMPPEAQTPKATIAARKRSAKLRLEVFSHYCGGTPHCQCPGCTVVFIGFLQLDDGNGNGAVHRKANNLGTGAMLLWQWVKDHGYPDDFQVLCCNCNHSKFNGKACALAGQSHVGSIA
jgi:hypothetical protein